MAGHSHQPKTNNIMKSIEELIKINAEIEREVQELEMALYKFIEKKGGFIYFNVEAHAKWPDCPIVRLIEMQDWYSRYKLEPAHEHLIHALKVVGGDIMFFTSRFEESFNEAFTKEEIANIPLDDDRWHSLFLGEDIIYYDTLYRICVYLEEHYDELFHDED